MGLARPDYDNNERNERRNDGGLRCSLRFYFTSDTCVALLALSRILSRYVIFRFQMSIVDTLVQRQ